MDATAREKTKIQTSSDALLQKAYDPPQQSGLLSGFSAAALWKATGWVSDADLSAEESASTLFRFFRSRHVRDLKLIFTAALFVCLSHIALVLLIAVVDAVTGGFKSVSEGFSFIFEYVGPGIPIYGIVMGWAYQSASKRLGIVDLFACEIGTLCRVGTIFDIGKRYVDAYFAAPSDKPPSCASFVSKEEYFPVFASNSRDLKLLEESVVNYITEFYTYMKALRDSLRRLAETNPPHATHPAVAGLAVETPWHIAMLNVIYLMYLGYESARKAIRDLVEYQPAKALNHDLASASKQRRETFAKLVMGPPLICDSPRPARLSARPSARAASAI